jgi:DDE superfamily endonuclease
MTQSEALRDAFLQEMSTFDLVFLDESIFNEKTGWRHRAYAPVGHEPRYVANVRRGDTYAIIAAMTLNGWLPCTAVKRGYYSKEPFIDWLKEHLIHLSGRISQTLGAEYQTQLALESPELMSMGLKTFQHSHS